jgi:hypothetical protein
MTALKYLVVNETDGEFASPDKMTLAEAQRFVQDFPLRYQEQGYYLTADGIRISPEDVSLLILEG